MSNKSFSVRQFDIIGDSGNPKITSTEYIELNTPRVAISTDVTVGGTVRSDLTLTNHTVTSAQLNVTGIGTITHSKASELHVTGVGTISQANTPNLNVIGIATVTSLNVTNASNRLKVSGDTFLKPQAVGLGTTTTTGRDAGITTATGTLIYIPDVGLQVYAGDAAGWKTIANTSASGSGGASFNATGGDVTVEPGNGYKYHTFLNTGDFITGSNAGTVEVLIVGGGGGGGDYSDTGNAGGGGGAGGLVHHAALTLSASTTYPIAIGDGGPASPSPNGSYVGGNGGHSTAFGMTAMGGGGGGGYTEDGATGGSGGGGVGSGPANQTSQNAPFQLNSDFSQFGNAGGTGNAGAGDFGGGGGAGGTGDNHGSGQGGAGGIGRQYPQFHGNLLNVPGLAPFNGYFAGGGGGGDYPSNAPAFGGLGGGGGPNNNPQTPTDTQPIPGTNGTGGGGAGGSLSDSGGTGGKGIVVIRYPA